MVEAEASADTTESEPAEQSASEASAETEDDTPQEDTRSTQEASMSKTAELEPTFSAPEDRRPVARVHTPTTIIAAGDVPGKGVGSPFANSRDVADGMVQRLHALRRTSGGDGEQVTVASIIAEFPEDRMLSSQDPEANWTKIQKVSSREALTAAAGVCAPLDVSYDIFGVGCVERPVKEALATFSADRGGIRYVKPPELSFVEGAVGFWDSVTGQVVDIQGNPTAAGPGGVPAAGTQKPCLSVDCPCEEAAIVDAVTLCLCFNNLTGRVYPEMVERHNEMGLIQHARFAEMQLLKTIKDNSTHVGPAAAAAANTASKASGPGNVFGSARDALIALDQAVAGYRSRNRICSDVNLRVIMPEWFKNYARADVVAQAPSASFDETFALADAAIDRWFAARNVNVTWSLDLDVIGAQPDNQAFFTPPAKLEFALFTEGTWLFLDGGTLDLGIVRDSTLNKSNEYCMFVETFESAAFIGLESLWVDLGSCLIKGAAAELIATTC